MQVDLAVIAKEMTTLSVTKAKLSEALRKVESDQELIKEAESVIKTFGETLKANPALASVIAPK